MYYLITNSLHLCKNTKDLNSCGFSTYSAKNKNKTIQQNTKLLRKRI